MGWREEAAANGHEVGPAHLLVALLLEGESVAAGTGCWLGMTPGGCARRAAQRAAGRGRWRSTRPGGSEGRNRSLDAIRHAHDNGAVVGGVSAGSRVWGVGTLSDYASLGDPEPLPLFGWLGDLVVVNHYGTGREPELRRTLAAFPGCRGLAIAHGGAVLATDGISVLHPGVTGTPHVLLAGADQNVVPLGG